MTVLFEKTYPPVCLRFFTNTKLGAASSTCVFLDLCVCFSFDYHIFVAVRRGGIMG